MSTSGKDMNDEEYKKAIAADPSGSFEGAEYADTNEAAAAYRDEIRALDERISGALNIEVPELKMPDLPPIEDDNVVSLPVKTRSNAPTWFSIAAGFALAAFIGVQMGVFGGGPTSSLADQVLEHMDHEPYALTVTDVPVGHARFEQVVNRVGTMKRDVGLISYAQSCIINGREAPHLVIQGEKGPVTLILMPHEMVDGASTIDGEGVEGVILPVGSGSIAIVGERDEDLTVIQDRVIESVEWGI